MTISNKVTKEKNVMTFSDSNIKKILQNFTYIKTPVDKDNEEFYVKLTGKLFIEEILELDKFMEELNNGN